MIPCLVMRELVLRGRCSSAAELRRAIENAARAETRVLAFMAHGEEGLLGSPWAPGLREGLRGWRKEAVIFCRRSFLPSP